ncbi:MAG TPA: hypothetical protein VG650_06495 [Mycobacteriales bacterium]|nr:hypothetical protein [Mycobacteriales bacterium]
MNIDLNDDDALVLRAYLEGCLSELYAEISHTDNPAFRQQLKDRRDALRRVHDRIGELVTR